jgi:RES domain-containing protein
MAPKRRAHDDRLLDALGTLEGRAFSGPLWRVVRHGRSALDGSRGAGRWNPAHLSVLYTGDEPDGAIAEMHFHLSLGQPVFPSKMRHDLVHLEVNADRTLVLADMNQLMSLGVEAERYKELLYRRTQEIGDAAAFLGFDGLIAPSARHECNVVVLFLPEFSIEDATIVSETPIDWAAWRSKKQR